MKDKKVIDNLTYQIVNVGCDLELKKIDKSVTLDEVNCNQRKNIEFKRWIFISCKRRRREHSQSLDESDVRFSKRTRGELALLSDMENDNDEQDYYDNSQNFGIIAKTQNAIKDFMDHQHS